MKIFIVLYLSAFA